MFPDDWAATGRLDGDDARVLFVRPSLVRPGVGLGVLFRVSPPPPSAGAPAKEDTLDGGASKRMPADAHMGPADVVHQEHSGGWGGCFATGVMLRVSFLSSVVRMIRELVTSPGKSVSFQKTLSFALSAHNALLLSSPAKHLSVSATLRAAYSTAFPSWHAGPSIALDPAYR
jgi:hypothetical protein